MAGLLIIVGLIITVAGLVLVVVQGVRPVAVPTVQSESPLADLGKVVEEFNKLLDKVDKKYRIGIIVMAVGLALVGIGAYLEAKDAKQAAEQVTSMAEVVSVLPPVMSTVAE
jgi:uncharacterized membrane protein